MRGTFSEDPVQWLAGEQGLKWTSRIDSGLKKGCLTSPTYAAMRSKSFSQDHTDGCYSCGSTSVLQAAKACRVAHVPSKAVVVFT